MILETLAALMLVVGFVSYFVGRCVGLLKAVICGFLGAILLQALHIFSEGYLDPFFFIAIPITWALFGLVSLFGQPVVKEMMK